MNAKDARELSKRREFEKVIELITERCMDSHLNMETPLVLGNKTINKLQKLGYKIEQTDRYTLSIAWD